MAHKRAPAKAETKNGNPIALGFGNAATRFSVPHLFFFNSQKTGSVQDSACFLGSVMIEPLP